MEALLHRNFRKLKELADYARLDAPRSVAPEMGAPMPPVPELHILRMLVRPKYGKFQVPRSLDFISTTIQFLSGYDMALTGILSSWCYVTVRHGPLKSETDDEWHFDGASFRTDIIPERNYVWVNHSPTEYKLGGLAFPEDFDPTRHDLFSFATEALAHEPVHVCEPGTWYLISPFCLHRRPPVVPGTPRTFYRIAFTDVEGRDVNNTQNPLLPTDAYGRDPVRTFRSRLKHYVA